MNRGTIVNALRPEDIEAIAEHANRTRIQQLRQGGLVILQALYGDIIDINEELRTDHKPGQALDITMYLQALVDPVESSLVIITNGLHLHECQEIPDPNPGTTSRLIRDKIRLYVAYIFDGIFHWTLLDPKSSLVLPQPSHREEKLCDIHDMDVLINNVGVPPSALPTFLPDGQKLDEEGYPYFVEGELWDRDPEDDERYRFDPQTDPNMMQDYVDYKNKRPSFFYVEPRDVAYQRHLHQQHKKDKQKLVMMGGGVALTVLVVALHALGAIDLGQVPGLNLIFGSSSSSSSSSEKKEVVEQQKKEL